MREVRILEIKQSVFADNDRQAQSLRKELKEKGVFLLNLMSSPGSGKTTTLMRTIERLKDSLRIGVMEADIDSDVDARTISESGAKVIQLHTGGMCHLDAQMTRQGLEGLETDDVELVILENVGNLVCPAEFDVVLINKIDVLPYFDFDMEKCREYIHMRNPKTKIIPLCAKTGEGIEEWADWLLEEAENWKK